MRTLAVTIFSLMVLFGGHLAFIEMGPDRFHEDVRIVFSEAARLFNRDPNDFTEDTVERGGLLNDSIYFWRKKRVEGDEVIYVTGYRSACLVRYGPDGVRIESKCETGLRLDLLREVKEIRAREGKRTD